jgi:hypothetical protein
MWNNKKLVTKGNQRGTQRLPERVDKVNFWTRGRTFREPFCYTDPSRTNTQESRSTKLREQTEQAQDPFLGRRRRKRRTNVTLLLLSGELLSFCFSYLLTLSFVSFKNPFFVRLFFIIFLFTLNWIEIFLQLSGNPKYFGTGHIPG